MNKKPPRFKDSKFRYVEAELYSYPETLNEIELIREQILESTSQPDTMARVQSSGKSDPTGARAALLFTHRRLRHLEQVRDAIDHAFNKLPPEKQKLIQLKYWEKRLANKGVAEELFVSEMTFYRWREQIVVAVAYEMGLVKLDR